LRETQIDRFGSNETETELVFKVQKHNYVFIIIIIVLFAQWQREKQ